jgi:superfamily II DNA or RNA helicase
VQSHLVGDVIDQYRRYGNDGRMILFATDVETASEFAVAFRAAGITALALSGKSSQADRDNGLDAFETGKIKVLVNVDLFDEGFDVPAAEICGMARPTESAAKFLQMIGRVLRPVYAEGYDLSTAAGRRAAIAAGPKPTAVVIDPVRNWERHGLPSWPRSWALDGREINGRRKVKDTVLLRVCAGCTQPFEAFLKVCPYCGTPVVYAGRKSPDQVEGDLEELDQDALAAVFRAMHNADQSDEEYQRQQIARNVPYIGRARQLKAHQRSRYRRDVLKNLMGWWYGCQPADRPLSEKHRRFYHRYGIDSATAMTLNAAESDALAARISQLFEEDMT